MMNGKRPIQYSALALAALLLVSFAIAGSADAAKPEKCKYVDTVDLEYQITLTHDQMVDMYLGLYDYGIVVPEVIVNELMDRESVTITLDGMAHVNVMLSVSGDTMDLNLQGTWRGTILIQTPGYADILLSFKNAQLMGHVNVPSTMEDIDMNVNLHANGKGIINGATENVVFDLDFHVRLLIQNGMVKNMYFDLPEWTDLLV